MPMMLKGSEKKTQKQDFWDLSEYFKQIPLQAASTEHMVQEAMKKMSVFFKTDLSMESNDPIK